MSTLLAGLAAVALVAAGRELLAGHGEAAAERGRHLLAGLSRTPWSRLGGTAPAALVRIRRAGLHHRLTPGALLLARASAAAAATPGAAFLAGSFPGRTSILLALGLPAAAAAAPDAWLESRGRRRARRIALALPDALELMAVGAASGRGAASLLADAAAADRGPLSSELAAVVAEVESGRAMRPALRRLAAEGGPELAALATLLERSHRLGSPLSSALHERASALREEAARERRERAARAAPKIQLAVALLLVPSVLLVLAAAILANADALLAGL